MCRFCNEMNPNMDVRDKEFFSDDIDFGFAGVLYFTGTIELQTKSLKIGIVNWDGDAKEYRKKISYCPFCGEKLQDIIA
ncbi:hypothetical protein [Butyrivibrio sp. WCD2001]|uniref:hypothetical protein n=1 Tax=Butyrivibrio sp. WCD2001 TaxID=1280681 RepID=UPI0003FFBEC7|nr:hypothetical protein [Butyrivibrio sp. WCD2001]